MRAATAPPLPQRGIQYWMKRVTKEIERARTEFQPDPVHDLRVALRRCRAIAEGIRAVDPDSRWKKMRRTAKALFSSLGDLRDIQVLEGWVIRLFPEDDDPRVRLLAHLVQRQAELKTLAAEALKDFDTAEWLRWSAALEDRLRLTPIDSRVFEVIALEKLEAVMELQRVATRTRSKTAIHSLRIGLKRLRYVVENFLPEYDARWGKELKELQDVLGEIHDLDVLWSTALRTRSFTSPEERTLWREAITKERARRVAFYKAKLNGRGSLLRKWRTELPAGRDLREAIAAKFEVWASFLDSDPERSKRVLSRSLALYERIHSLGFVDVTSLNGVDGRDLLTAAAISRRVGQANGKRVRRKRTARKLERLDAPPEWTAEHLRIAGFIARCYRGMLPLEDPVFVRMALRKQQFVKLLGGTLRLAEALDAARPPKDPGASMDTKEGYLLLKAEDYKNPEEIAAAAYLLETACKVPIFVLTSADSTGRRRTKR